ncbi:MAG: phosphatidylglycerol lysyltransferase domain-containing protein [Candidatus Peribacteraceae bacterium]|nr:phosphatidylglycerol lysyltransferase domain-containing protein [Candidatus Peribacteraceae bacterium]MDD5740023.1 phosphatidylglycerol lysyltransferase domain-containing protein [Candidatus Peribacteraceae bacterium]
MEPPLAPSLSSPVRVSTIATGTLPLSPHALARMFARPQGLTVEGVRACMRLLTLKDQTVINDYLKKYPPNVCELSFANLLHWNSTYPHYLEKASPHCFCEADEHLLIGFYDAKGRMKLYQPIGPAPERIIRQLNAGRLPVEWTCVEESIALKAETGDCIIASDRDNSDYVYLLDELRTLKGKKFHRKRTYINHCLDFHPTAIPLTGSMAESCLAVNRKWLACKDNPHDTDTTALEVALQNFDTFKLIGIGVLINGALESFAIGEPLNETTFVSHFLKANYAFPGLFQYTSYAFAKAIPPPFTHLNKEQDLGIEGLRVSKEGWCPAAMVRKYTIRNAQWKTANVTNSVEIVKQGPTGV